MQERDDDFLALFPHRYDFIYAPHPDPGDRPQWQTESRYPLSDRLIQQGAHLYGVRFSHQTQYCLLDVDVGSAYHPRQDPLAWRRLVAALEPLGLVGYLACTSSYSQGLHLYFPFEAAQNSWQLATVVTTLLENAGFHCSPGQLEVFPNPKLYVVDGTPNLFQAHRLPLQAGSYLLNGHLEPVSGDHRAWVEQWRWCQRRNAIAAPVLQRLLQQQQRRRYRVSQRAEKFLNDLNAEIELGWTGKGQTNHLLGRITMRAYIFHHVLQGGGPLSGEALVEAIVATAQALPGYREWCGHQQEIQQRATEWARCIENSHYFPYGTQRGKYRAKQGSQTATEVETTWNEQRSQTAQDKIRMAMQDLFQDGTLAATTTARFKQLLTYGIGGSTLYKYKSLWHPDLWHPPQTPPASNGAEATATATPAAASYPLSLFPDDDRNPPSGNGLSDFGDVSTRAAGAEVRNVGTPLDWRQLRLDLETRRSHQKQQARSRSVAHWQAEARQEREDYREKMLAYLRSGDPILVREGIRWLGQQREVPPDFWYSLPDELALGPEYRRLLGEKGMRHEWQTFSGTIAQGYRVASGLTAHSPYPDGALAMQLPHFLARGFDLRPYFLGTLNVAIAPSQFRLVQPTVTLEQVAWTDAHGPETFSFARCRLQWQGQTHEGWVYYPHPETKPMHFQRPDLMEVVMPKIAGLGYGDRVELSVLRDEIQKVPPGQAFDQPAAD